MNEVQIKGLFLNLIIYTVMITPVIVVSLNKKFFTTKKKFLTTLIYCTFLEIALSFIVFLIPEKIFSLFTHKNGIVNFSVYASKIIFISSSLFALKVLIPAYLNQTKKITIFVLSKIVITVAFCIIFYILFSTKGFLFAFPICDFIFYIICILKIIC